MQKYSAEREKLRDLLAESTRLGVSLDAKFNEGNTLLHFSVALDMYDEVVFLLEAGANYLITNKEGLSPRDIALESGNQKLLYLFRRESWYRSYTYANCKQFNPDLETRELNGSALSLLATPAVGYADISYTFWYNNGSVGVLDNYLDWTDSQICIHLQDMIEQFRVQEQKFLNNLETLKQQRDISMKALSSMHQPLRNHEHKICRKLFTIQELVRQYRDKVNAYAEEKMSYKQEIQAIRKKIFFRGVCQQRVHNGYLIKLWKFCTVTLTGEHLVITDSSPPGNGSTGSLKEHTEVEEALTSSELDLTSSADCCRHGVHYIPVRDIYHVETVRSGFHSGSPCVSFGITVKQRGVKDCRHLQTVSSSSHAGGGDKIKLRKLTISIPAVPLDKADRPPKKSNPAKSVENTYSANNGFDPIESFPIQLSDVTASYFDDCVKAKNQSAHVFLLALRATSHNIRFGGNYLPSGWQSGRRRSSASRESTPGSTGSDPTPLSLTPSSSNGNASSEKEKAEVPKKGKVESFFDRIFSSECAVSEKSSPSLSVVSSADKSLSDSGLRGVKIEKSSPLVRDRLSASENDDDIGPASLSRRGTATSRESASTQQSVSYSSSLSSSSLPRMSSLLSKGGSTGSLSHDLTSRSSGITSDSARDSSSTGRPSSILGEAIGFAYAPTSLETVSEREERQFSSDSEGQFSCKLAAHLAGIVAESVAEPVSSSYGLRRKRSSSSIASNAENASMSSASISANRQSSTPPLGWDMLQDTTTAPIPIEPGSTRPKRTVHYEDSRESSIDSQPAFLIGSTMSSSMKAESTLASAMNAAYDVEALSGPSMLRSKSLPFKLPSTDCIPSGDTDQITESQEGAAAMHLKDIDAAELQRVTTIGAGLDSPSEKADELADWRSVESADHHTRAPARSPDPDDSMHVAVDLADIVNLGARPATENPIATIMYRTPEKPIRSSFVHPLLSPCTQEGIDVNTNDNGLLSSRIDSAKSGRATSPSNHSLGELFEISVDDEEPRGRADSGWGVGAGSGIEDRFCDIMGSDLYSVNTGCKIMSAPSSEDTVLSRIKNDVTDSPTALLVRATPSSPAADSDSQLPGNPACVVHQLSPLMRSQRKHVLAKNRREYTEDEFAVEPVALDMGDATSGQPLLQGSDDVRPSYSGNDRTSAVSNTTDAADDFGSFPGGSYSHNSVYEQDRLSVMYSPRYSTLSSVGGYRGTMDSLEEAAMLGLISDPEDPAKPTSRMTISISSGSPQIGLIADAPPPRRMSGLAMLPPGGIDSPSVLRMSPNPAGVPGPSTPATRAERSSFCYGSAKSSLTSKQEAINVLKKEATPTGAVRRGSNKNKMMKFRTLEDMRKSLEKVREISAVGEERLTIALNDREVEHQKFTYLLALRGIVDHLPSIEDRVQFLSGSAGNGGFNTHLDGADMAALLSKDAHCESPGGNTITGYSTINSSHSATAILAAATASFAAANTSCNNTTIAEDDVLRNSIHSRHSVGSGENILFDYSPHVAESTFEDFETDCRVISRDFTDWKPDVDLKKHEALVPPSPLWHSSHRNITTSGTSGIADENGRTESISTVRLSSVDYGHPPNMRRSVSRSSSSAVTPTAFRNSLGASDRPGLAGSPSFAGGFLKQLSEESVSSSRSQSTASASKALMMSKDYLTERFGPEVGCASEIHSLPPVTALLCVPMGQPPDDLLEKYNTIFDHLKAIYSLDKAIFDHIQRLAEINHLRDDLRNRYWSLQQQANKVTAPRAGDLYDVDL